ncbi:hypothetical protein ACFGVS_00510 [Mucilaginibacter sp. AW1-7]|uniref:hypothetical protein n=1 Tax=Mucilaginibacter sp. AW1-7 TaxID=3349874 RepID=UPI003F73470B
MKTILKTILCFFLVNFGCYSANAQFLGSFLSQQSQQRKLMAAQIAEYQTYLGALKTGYHITQTGLKTAHDLKNGTFTLHSDYISSLSQVNPVIQNNPKGKAIADLNNQTVALLPAEINWQQQQRILTAAEMGYLQKVGDNLTAKCKLDMDELLQILTPGKLQLTDAQRLARLDKLYNSMKDKYAFAGSFTSKCRKLALNRKQQSQDKGQLKKLYGIQ